MQNKICQRRGEGVPLGGLDFKWICWKKELGLCHANFDDFWSPKTHQCAWCFGYFGFNTDLKALCHWDLALADVTFQTRCDFPNSQQIQWEDVTLHRAMGLSHRACIYKLWYMYTYVFIMIITIIVIVVFYDYKFCISATITCCWGVGWWFPHTLITVHWLELDSTAPLAV